MNTTSFYNDLDLRYPAIGILLEDSIWNPLKEEQPKAKIYLPILFPEVKNSLNVLEQKELVSKRSITNSNYILLYIPEYLYNTRFDEDNNVIRILEKGTRVVVVFVDGDLDSEKIKIISKYNDEKYNRVSIEEEINVDTILQAAKEYTDKAIKSSFDTLKRMIDESATGTLNSSKEYVDICIKTCLEESKHYTDSLKDQIKESLVDYVDESVEDIAESITQNISEYVNERIISSIKHLDDAVTWKKF